MWGDCLEGKLSEIGFIKIYNKIARQTSLEDLETEEHLTPEVKSELVLLTNVIGKVSESLDCGCVG